MKKQSTLSIMDKMVKENNQGIMLSTTITDIRFVKQGAIIAFGVYEEIGKYANTQIVIGSSDYIFKCIFILCFGFVFVYLHLKL